MGNKNRLRNTIGTSVLIASLSAGLGVLVYDQTIITATGEEVYDAVDTTQKVSIVDEPTIKQTIIEFVNKTIETATKKEEYKTGYVTEALKVREKPSEDSKVYEVFYLNEPIEYCFIDDDDFVKIKYNDSYAYLKKDYISDEEQIIETTAISYTEPETEEYYEPEQEVEEPTYDNDVNAISASYFRKMGVVYSNGWRWTWYSQNVLPGGGLDIPGRHVDSNGYVCDEDGYICLASSVLPKGTVVSTPFGKAGKVYDSGCAADTLDVYVAF